MAATELDMRDRFNRQTRFQAAFIDGFNVFQHTGARATRPTRTPRGIG